MAPRVTHEPSRASSKVARHPGAHPGTHLGTHPGVHLGTCHGPTVLCGERGSVAASLWEMKLGTPRREGAKARECQGPGGEGASRNESEADNGRDKRSPGADNGYLELIVARGADNNYLELITAPVANHGRWGRAGGDPRGPGGLEMREQQREMPRVLSPLG